MNANDLADRLEQFYTGTHITKSAEVLRQQQAEIEILKEFIAKNNAIDKKLFESIQKSNEVWDKATKSILKKAQKK